ncbi:c-type cytochrome [Alkalimarinus sediminis]|uniref:Cytochrome c n=2 Tax=Alkalimarinus sediminis TaxID=1632866 RepID=A0A9E8KRN3_9ALTE|nr:cytochrome c [Alkalimarinus sediminis]UZW76282.1 cytochrome c [Alkalimarinus sediminis]
MRSSINKTGLLTTFIVATSVLTTACSDQGAPSISASNETTGRWYSDQQVLLGKQVYDANCIDCHNPKARGTFKWKQPLEDGTYPPPPLNGSAHAWHHPISALMKTINDGGIEIGGKMPPFREVLKDDEKVAVIAYFQSFWNDEIYSRWQQRNQPK